MSQTRIGRKETPAHVRPGPAIVLVEPQLGENIGAAARAMLNFSLGDLRLVRPRDGWPNPAAIATASGADFVIERARVFDSVADAVADRHYVLAATARPREMLLPVLSPREAAGEIAARLARGEEAAILFGGERAGLANDDVARADAIVSIPVNPAFASLNLAQAVLVTAYEWAAFAGLHAFAAPAALAETASRKDVDGLADQLVAALDAADYFFPPDKRPVMERNLRVLLARIGLTESEARTMRGVVKSLARRA